MNNGMTKDIMAWLKKSPHWYSLAVKLIVRGIDVTDDDIKRFADRAAHEFGLSTEFGDGKKLSDVTEQELEAYLMYGREVKLKAVRDSIM